MLGIGVSRLRGEGKARKVRRAGFKYPRYYIRRIRRRRNYYLRDALMVRKGLTLSHINYHIKLLLLLTNSYFFYRIFVKRLRYRRRRRIRRGFLALNSLGNNIFGLLSDGKYCLKYWCTPASLKLIKKKKTRKFNLDLIAADLLAKVVLMKYRYLYLSFKCKRFRLRKVLDLFKGAKRIKLMVLTRSLDIRFNGCKLGSRPRKRRRLKFSYAFKYRVRLYTRKLIPDKYENIPISLT